MTIKAPLADDVFERWLKSKSAGDIEKKFGRKVSEISPMEVVGKEIHKSPALLIRTLMRKTAVQKSSNKDVFYSYKQMEKETFYRFTGSVKQSEWKEKSSEIFSYDKIVESNCPECSGKGVDGQCRSCKGSGVDTAKIEVITMPDNKKNKVERKLKCSNCHGTGVSPNTCKTCEGTGIVYRFPIDLVPFAGAGGVHFFWNEQIEKEMNKSKFMKGTELADLLDKNNVSPIKINDLKNLEQKNLEPELGFWDKEASKQAKECKNSFENLDKSGAEAPQLPIEIYPLQRIDIETYKGKKFSICSVGSASGYIIFDLDF